MTTTITPAHVQHRANRDGKPWHLIGNTIVDNDDLIVWYDGALPDGALTFAPAVISDDPYAPLGKCGLCGEDAWLPTASGLRCPEHEPSECYSCGGEARPGALLCDACQESGDDDGEEPRDLTDYTAMRNFSGALNFDHLDDPPGPDPDPSTGLGSSNDEGDDPDAYHCCGNWSSHHIQQCPDILDRLLAPDLTPEQEQRFTTFRDSIRARFAELEIA